MLQVSKEQSCHDWRALLLYSGSLQHDRGMTTISVRFLSLPGKIKKALDCGGVCALASLLDAHYVRVETELNEGREWTRIHASLLMPLEQLRREQQRARSASWSRRPPRPKSPHAAQRKGA